MSTGFDSLINCTCKENPLCTKCDGRGYYHSYEDPLIHSVNINRSRTEVTVQPITPEKRTTHITFIEIWEPVISCPHCNCLLLKKNLWKHIKKHDRPKKKDNVQKPKHKRKKTNHQIRASKSTLRGSKPSTTENFNTLNAATNAKAEKNLDGSKDFHVYRENGRFGSHSSFDNFDDESHP